MEFLNSTISNNSRISPAFSFLTWKSRINPSRLTTELPLRRSLSLYIFRPIPSTKFQISARFGGPTNRQNYLRKKLTRQHRQLQPVSDLQNLVREFDEVNNYESEFDDFGGSSKNLEGRSLDGVNESETETRKKQFGESIMWNKLESWVELYKKDSEFWGIGSGHIFTIYQDSEGKVDRVVVNDDEILRRSRVNQRLDNETEDLDEVNFKISFAKDLATEMENGGNVIPKNSSVAKFLPSGRESRFMEMIRGVALKPGSLSRMSRVGVLVLCGLSVVWAVRWLFVVGDDDKEYSRLEKEMLRRKMKARTEKEKMAKGSGDVMQEATEPRSMSFTRPQLDKEELLNSIVKAKGDTGRQNKEFKNEIEEIRAVARQAREIEKGDALPGIGDGEDYQALKEFPGHSASLENDLTVQNDAHDKDSDEITETVSFTDPKYGGGKSADEASDKKSETQCYDIPSVIIPNGTKSTRTDVSSRKLALKSSSLNDAKLQSDGPGPGPVSQSGPREDSSRKKLRIIKSAKEAREYLSRKHCKLEVDRKHEVRNDKHSEMAITMASRNTESDSSSKILDLADKVHGASPLSGMHEFSHLSRDNRLGNDTAEGSMPDSTSTEVDRRGLIQTEVPTPLKKHNSEDTETNGTLIGSSSTNEVKDRTAELAPTVNQESWIEKNFHVFEPIVKKIGIGFRDNYLVAREKANAELHLKTEIAQPKSDDAENELEWMKDERLRQIVFKVRDNELSGRDPFHLMDEEDKCLFFSGLEKKAELENGKLLKLHEYFHSNIENLDYGVDGISLYDPPEKIMARWKVPPAEKNPEFLNKFVEIRKALVAESLKTSFLSKKTGKEIVRKAEETSPNENTPMAGNLSNSSTELRKDALASSKTIIEGSDGSVRKGKRSGKEYWQHTKKWSQGFLESYNEETDPEVKAVMRDIGKDLDRWITEKEIEEAADLMMDKLPEKGQNFIKQKLDKVKREMELFGPQAVVSKYREYAEEKDEDYLWWLDLPFVLCIELYTVENGGQRVGFYSLEMAADLELNPKQYHVIAFEDAGDCKNLCYIIQAHMEMLGNGNAFVVARPPKDAFREAKANGFSVTVIRKGQLQLNIDQTLEEVEESIVEMGSKIYHDKITKERGADINALMKGVFGFSKPAKRKRSKRRLKKHIKP